MNIETEHNDRAKAFVAAFAHHGARSLIGNLDTEMALLPWGDRLIPMSINSGAAGGTFLCSPKMTYVDYLQDELRHFPNPKLVSSLKVITNGIGLALRLAGSEHIVHLNNWLLSTNLPIALDPTLASQMTTTLATQFPRHLLAMRSLTQRQSAPLIAALLQAGWLLLPSRQVYLLEDVAKESFTRRDSKRDQAMFDTTSLRYQELAEMSATDAARIAHLYELLYLEKYSRLNPAFTPDFIALSHDIGLIKYLVFRDEHNIIQSFSGFYQSDEHATLPLLGYNTSLPQDMGLYRLAFYAGARLAAQRNLQFNMSSGATGFKINRGAKPEIEYTAFYIRHLPWQRQWPVHILRVVARFIGLPLLRKYNL